MKTTKIKKLEKAGWTVGSVSDFLELSPAEEMIVAMKLALAADLRALREKKHITQEQLAKQIGSSQSRVAKIENADKSVSIELLVKSLASLGASRSHIGKAIASNSRSRKELAARA